MSNFLKLVEEDYCCLYGYLALCRARGERTLDMAKNLGVPSRTIRYHYTILDRSPQRRDCAHRCQKKGVDCLHPHIEAIASEKG